MSTDRRFVILEHDHPSVHWDFMLEADGVLRTWRLPAPPGAVPQAGEMPAEEIADHRLAYLDYEGPVSGERGSVKRVDRGNYHVVAAAENMVHVTLWGTVVVGEVVLKRRDGTAWTATWRFCD